MLKGKKDNFITLKEAADMSGYSSDYLGQLIRSGKLEGEQVFMNVAWMTTREAVEEYLEKTKNKKAGVPEAEQTQKERFVELWKEHWSTPFTFLLYLVIAMNAVFIVFLFHLSSLSVERHFENKDMERERTTPVIPMATQKKV